MSVEQIKAMYDNMYSTRYNDLAKAKADSLSQLDSQFKQGKENFYNQRNGVAASNSQQTQRIRDYMAKNNLMGSGESVDAQLRNSTDLANSMGGIQKSENDFNKGIEDNRFKINRNFEGDTNALRSDIESQKAKAMMEWQRQEQQLAIQREQLAMQRAAAASRGSSGGGGGGSSKQELPTDPQKALALLRQEALNDPLRVGNLFKTYYANTPGMEYVVKEAAEYQKNWRYYADKWGLSDTKAKSSTSPSKQGVELAY